MDRYQETFKAWDKVAKLYQDKFMDVDLYNDTYDLFCNRLTKRNPHVLEIGCGPGNITRYLLHQRPDWKIDAIDIAPSMIELAAFNNPAAKCMVMDSRHIDQLEATYDAVIVGFCLPYLSKSDCSKLIQDCNALMQNNGTLYLSFVEGDYGNSGYQMGSSGDKMYFYFHELDDLTKDLHTNTFHILATIHKEYQRSKDVTEIHTVLLAEKRATR